MWLEHLKHMLASAPLGYLAERAPLGGGELEMPKNAFRKQTSSSLPVFTSAQPITKKYRIENWYMCCLYVSSLHIFRFLDAFKILDFIDIYFRKIEVLGFGDQNRIILKI